MPSRGSIYLSDPVHGFVDVPRETILPILETRHVQRLRRIRQIGVAYLAFPGAEHTRFTHAVGAMALMQDTLKILARHGTPISHEEHAAALAAVLLHDIGHAPFSHSCEKRLILETPHEDISGALIKSLASELGPPVDLALKMFNNEYERSFFYELIASQLDMDRMDYLRRDSHFTGVIEGRIGVERILYSMRVHPVAGQAGSHIAVVSKGVYAVEKMLNARRLMYWQVYLHKTVVAGDQMLWSTLQRARSCFAEGNLEAVAGITPALRFFLAHRWSRSHLENAAVLEAFLCIDDTDILASFKAWCGSTDKILADLSRRFMWRDLFRCTFLDAMPPEALINMWRERVADWLLGDGLSTPQCAWEDAALYLNVGYAEHAPYRKSEDVIRVIDRQGVLRDMMALGDAPFIEALTNFVEKPYVCYPKDADLSLPKDADLPL